MNEREAFEKWYAENAFNYERDPIGSRECGLQWKGWQARAHVAKFTPDWAGYRQGLEDGNAEALAQPAQAVDVGPGSAHKDEDPVKLARAGCEAVIKHQFQDEHRRGRLTLDVETFLSELNAVRDSGVTRALSCEKVAPVGDDRVLWGVVANAGRLSRDRKVRWAHVSDATGQGSNSSAALCRRFGFDPDEEMGGADNEPLCDLCQERPETHSDAEGIGFCDECWAEATAAASTTPDKEG